eukprot:SAG25_NODE_1861_length_2244_cov_1.411189_4_plen_231_part_00
MAHLGISNGFSHSVGSFKTGGQYGGIHHSLRWQNDHPIWDDAHFTSKPKGCGVKPPDFVSNSTVCDPKDWKNDTKMKCSRGAHNTFPESATTPALCCAACVADATCTHWIFNNTEDKKAPAPCHMKTGVTCPGNHREGATAGIVRPSTPAPPPGPPPGPAPGPSPVGPAQCTNEYSTDLWGSSALQAVEAHNTTNVNAPLYLHLCFQAVHTPYDAPKRRPHELNGYKTML